MMNGKKEAKADGSTECSMKAAEHPRATYMRSPNRGNGASSIPAALEMNRLTYSVERQVRVSDASQQSPKIMFHSICFGPLLTPLELNLVPPLIL
jgi:hypothetical protein